jgi:hypothetical protein
MFFLLSFAEVPFLARRVCHILSTQHGPRVDEGLVRTLLALAPAVPAPAVPAPAAQYGVLHPYGAAAANQLGVAGGVALPPAPQVVLGAGAGAPNVPGGGPAAVPVDLCTVCHERRVEFVFTICGHRIICGVCRTRLLISSGAFARDRLPNTNPKQFRRILCPGAFCQKAHLEEQVSPIVD